MVTGCIHGRFQPFHNGHYEYLCGAYDRCDRLIVGVTQYETKLQDDKSPDHRLDLMNNPFSFWERSELIRSAVVFGGLKIERISIVPFPIHQPKMIRNYIDQSAIMFTTIYDKWNLEKIKRLREESFCVQVLWRRRFKRFEGRVVREALREDIELASSMVPNGVLEAIEKLKAQNANLATLLQSSNLVIA